MGIFGVFLIAIVAHVSVGLPMFQAKLDSIIDGSPCIKQCMDKVRESNFELSITKTTDYSFYFQHLDEICAVATEARSCLDQCGVNPNPFSMKHMTVMCTQEAMKTALVFLPCMKEKGDEVNGECNKKCGALSPLNDEITDLTEKLKKNNNDRASLRQALIKTNEACGVTKCHARCSLEEYNNKCVDVAGVQPGEFVKAFIESSLMATREDLEQMNMMQVMASNTPPQCDYMYMPEMMFNVSADAEAVKALEQHIPDSPTELQRRQVMTEMLTLQHEVLLHELAVLQKRERNLDKESVKIDLEIAAIRKNSVNGF